MIGAIGLKNLIPIFGIMSVNVFFVLSSIIGYEYKGIEDSKLYVMYVVLIAVLNIFLLIKYLFTKNTKVTYRELIILIIPLFIFSSFLFSGIDGSFSPLAKTYFMYFLLWTTPAIYAAVYVNKVKGFNQLAKYIEVIMLLLTFSVISTAIIPFLSGGFFNSLGGATYQTASYLSAFAYGLNLYFLLYGDNHSRFRFTNMKIYRWICFLFLFIQFLGIFLSGGRGGIVLFTLYSIYIFFSVIKSKKTRKIGRITSLVTSFIVIISILLPTLLNNDRFLGTFNRTLQFISLDSGINWEGSSNRDILYLSTIELIKQKPFFGYGLFGFWDVSGYPHNIILEILLNGGIVYLSFFIFLLIILFKRLAKMIHCNPENRLLMVMMLYPLTMLMFSGTYIINTELWFVMSYIFISRYQQKEGEYQTI